MAEELGVVGVSMGHTGMRGVADFQHFQQVQRRELSAGGVWCKWRWYRVERK